MTNSCRCHFHGHRFASSLIRSGVPKANDFISKLCAKCECHSIHVCLRSVSPNGVRGNSKWYLNFIKFTRVESRDPHFNSHRHTYTRDTQTYSTDYHSTLKFIEFDLFWAVVGVRVLHVRTNFVENFSQTMIARAEKRTTETRAAPN